MVESKTGEQSKKEMIGVYLFSIKNCTDEKLYDVKVINSDYKNQNKITYEAIESGVSYDDIVEELSNINMAVYLGSIGFASYCDYSKFEQRQLSSNYQIITTNAFGYPFTTPSRIIIDPYQYQPNIANSITGVELNNNLQINLDFLMPDTELVLLIYLIKEKLEYTPAIIAEEIKPLISNYKNDK